MTHRAAVLLALSAIVPAAITAPARTAGEPPHPRSTVPVLLSSDVATGLVGGWRAGPSDIDDGLALGMALGLRPLEVRGIVVTLGNNNVQPELAVARRIVRDLLHRQEIPVLSGSSQRLTDPAVGWYDKQPLPAECVNDGVRFMAAELRKQRLAILAIGPLTDVACLALNDPRAGAAAKIVPCEGKPYYNAPDNSCPGHGPQQGHSLDKEASQLWLDLAGTPRRVKACAAYASSASKASFLDALFTFIP